MLSLSVCAGTATRMMVRGPFTTKVDELDAGVVGVVGNRVTGVARLVFDAVGGGTEASGV